MNKRNDIIDFLCHYVRTVKRAIPDINKGGCGIFTIALYNELVAMRLKPEIVAVIECADVITEKQNREINKCVSMYELAKRKNYECSHFAIKLNGFYIDAQGVYETPQKMMNFEIRRFALTNIKPEVLKKFNKNPKGWNDTYDRKDNPKVEAIVKKMIEKYKLVSNISPVPSL